MTNESLSRVEKDSDPVTTSQRRPHGARLNERAQSTVEYAILLLGAAAVAMLVVAWVSKSDVIGRLFDTVFGRIISQA